MRWYGAGAGQTPIDPDEAKGLRFDALTREDLDELEQANITDALVWGRGRRRLKTELLTVDGLLTLHKRMFGDVWSWAGTFRSTEKNIGVVPYQIGPDLQNACEDTAYWLDVAEWDPREAAARFHHRLVKVHVFPNGNGRHARVAADLLLHHRGVPPLTWPQSRSAYIASLRAADAQKYSPLLALLARK